MVVGKQDSELHMKNNGITIEIVYSMCEKVYYAFHTDISEVPLIDSCAT